MEAYRHLGEAYAIMEAAIAPCDSVRLTVTDFENAMSKGMAGLALVTRKYSIAQSIGYYDFMLGDTLENIDLGEAEEAHATMADQSEWMIGYYSKKLDLESNVMTADVAAKALDVNKRRIYALIEQGDLVKGLYGGVYAPSVEAYRHKRGNKKGGPYPGGKNHMMGLADNFAINLASNAKGGTKSVTMLLARPKYAGTQVIGLDTKKGIRAIKLVFSDGSTIERVTYITEKMDPELYDLATKIEQI